MFEGVHLAGSYLCQLPTTSAHQAEPQVLVVKRSPIASTPLRSAAQNERWKKGLLLSCWIKVWIKVRKRAFLRELINTGVDLKVGFPSGRFQSDTLRMKPAAVSWHKVRLHKEPARPAAYSKYPHVTMTMLCLSSYLLLTQLGTCGSILGVCVWSGLM